VVLPVLSRDFEDENEAFSSNQMVSILVILLIYLHEITLFFAGAG
jgi:hypothetical protein